jgi:hypothetical protein
LKHVIECRTCRRDFDLFAAMWCRHASRPSKVCPECGSCFCGLPAYAHPSMWKQAPPAFRKQGFDRIFVEYL